MGRSTRTNEHLVGTRTGVIRSRTVKRRPEALKWDRQLHDAMNFVPWLIDGPHAKPEAGWTPTPGCRACKVSSGVKRRGRPYNHTPECAQRQAVFREQLLEMKMLSAGEAPPVMEPVAGLVLPWLSMSENAGVSSSSSGVAVPQLVAGEPDPMVRRGLRRASEGDPEIAEICSLISDVNVNEEPHPQVPVGEFSDEDKWQALCAELPRVVEFGVKKDIPSDQATGPLLTFTWVRTVKNGASNYRLCLRAFWSTVRKEQRVSLLPDAWTTDLQNVASSDLTFCTP